MSDASGFLSRVLESAKARVLVAGFAGVIFLASALSATTTNTSADRVLGQIDLTTRDAGRGAEGLSEPLSLLLDGRTGANHLYVADTKNNRVLGYRNASTLTNGAPADLVIGQPNFCSTTCNSGGAAGAATLCSPSSIAFDGAGNLYVADAGNNRVLEYDEPFAALASDAQTAAFAANRVFGQPDFASAACNGEESDFAAPTATTLCKPLGVGTNEDYLFVADSGNNRVLRYDNPFANAVANLVIGQRDFSSFRCNMGAASNALSLCLPTAVAVDEGGNLYVADRNNNRVVEYDTPSIGNPPAHLVLGQPDFASRGASGCAGGSTSADGLCAPGGVAVDGRGNLYVTDSGNSRVVAYQSPLAPGPGNPGVPGSAGDTTADTVFGHQGSFAATASNDAGISAESLSFPGGVAVDDAGSLYVADTGNNRVTIYYAPSAPSSVLTTTQSSLSAAQVSGCSPSSAASARPMLPKNPAAAAPSTAFSVNPTSVSFGNVVFLDATDVGSVTKNITLKNKTANPTTDTLAIEPSPASADPDDFAASDNGCKGTVPGKPSKGCTVSVTFKPTALGKGRKAILDITDGDGNVAKVALAGNAIAGTIGVPKTLAFGKVKNGKSLTKPVKLTSAFSSPAISVSNVRVSGDYSVDKTSCTVTDGRPCLIKVTFAPNTAKGEDNGMLAITDNAANGGGTQDIALTGAAFGLPAPTATLTPTASSTGTPTATPTPMPGALVFSAPAQMPDSEALVSYSYSFCNPTSASGALCGSSPTSNPSLGEPPYAFSVANGSLPNGLSLNAQSGLVSGTPQVPSAGTNTTFEICATDSSSAQVCQPSALWVGAAAGKYLFSLSGTVNGSTCPSPAPTGPSPTPAAGSVSLMGSGTIQLSPNSTTVNGENVLNGYSIGGSITLTQSAGLCPQTDSSGTWTPSGSAADSGPANGSANSLNFSLQAGCFLFNFGGTFTQSNAAGSWSSNCGAPVNASGAGSFTITRP